MKKKIIFWVVVLFVLSSFASVPVEAKPKPKLSAKSKTMYVGKTAAVKLKSAGKVKWKTSKKSVVSISKKKKNRVWIKAKKAGKATITATYKKRTYKCRITVKKKKEKQAEADKTVMNASDITLYYVSEDDKPYLTLNPSHIYQYQFQVTGTKQEVLRWSMEGEGKTYFRIDDKGLLTMQAGPAYGMDGTHAVVVAKLENGKEVRAQVHGYSESVIHVEKVIEDFKSTYITAGMTEKQKMEKVAWYLGAMYDYKLYQESWITMLVQGGGDCMASRVAMMEICRAIGLKACACYQYEDHGETIVKADGVLYLVITGFNEPKPRRYMVMELTAESFADYAERNHIDPAYFTD